MDPIAEIVALVDQYGAEDYGDERVSQRAHALQSAALAEAAGSRPALIAGALLHDLGHLLDKHAERGRQQGVDRLHEQIGAGWVARWFEPEVAQMVRLHVPAKRWLCRCEPGYFESLSPGSVRSLALQGGPFTPDEAAEFLALPGAEDAIAVRRWDDLAKVHGLATPPLAHYIPALQACLL
jgi:gamma-butyrobetaine dioxygenase